MNTSNASHLDDDQLARAAVDEAELPFPLREHLSTCPVCRANRERTLADLARLGRMAARFAPSPTKRIALPATEPGTIARWSWGWRTYVGAVVAAALVLAVLWRVPALRSPSGQSVNMLTVETPDAEEFMTEVALLVDNPLPAVYEDISAETIAGVDEELMEFVVPSAEDEPLTQNDGKRGVSLC